MAKLTKRVLDRTPRPPKGRRVALWDSEVRGFGARVTAGSVTFLLRYRPGAGGRKAPKRNVTIGAMGSPWTPDSARQEAKRLLALVAMGEDPAAERADQRKGPPAELTVARLGERFIERHAATLRASTRESYEGIIRRRVIAAWGSRHVADINRRDVAALVDRIEGEGFPVMARLAFAVIRKFFGWCIEKGHLDENPCDGMKGPASPRPRDRVLDDDEVRLFWQATAALGAPFRHAFRLLLLTAARRDEVGGLVWSELDLDRKLWRLPADRAKNDTGHEIDLAPLVVAEIDALDEGTARHLRDQSDRHRRGEPLTDVERQRYARRTLGPFVFGRRGTTPASGWSKAKRRLDDEMVRLRRDAAEPKRAGEPLTDADRKAYELAPWRIHDLRRTAATGMAAAGFGPEVVERVLNHQSGVRSGLVGVYQRHEYRDQRRAASLAWANHVAAIAGENGTGDNVVPMHRSEGEAASVQRRAIAAKSTVEPTG
jgi:integrase